MQKKGDGSFDMLQWAVAKCLKFFFFFCLVETGVVVKISFLFLCLLVSFQLAQIGRVFDAEGVSRAGFQFDLHIISKKTKKNISFAMRVTRAQSFKRSM